MLVSEVHQARQLQLLKLLSLALARLRLLHINISWNITPNHAYQLVYVVTAVELSLVRHGRKLVFVWRLCCPFPE